MKLLCILLPHFPLRCETTKRPELEGYPAAVTYTIGLQKLILDHSPELIGLERDMPVQQALGKHGQIELVHADMAYYWSVFNEILDALELKSPLVEGAKLGDIYVGLLGLESLYGDNKVLTEVMRQAIPEAFAVRFGIAEGKFPAYLAAIKSPLGGCQALEGDIAQTIKHLPSDLLPVSQKIRERLHDFGLHTLGSIASLPCARLEAQFGPDGKSIWQLANGRDETPFRPRLSEETVEDSTTLPSPAVSLDVLMMALEPLLTRALNRLRDRRIGINSILIWTRTWLSEHWERRINFKEPAMNAVSILPRINQVMESSPQPGPVEQIGLKVTGAGSSIGRQGSILTDVRSHDHLLAKIRQYELQQGKPQLFKVKEIEPWSRIPERRYSLAPLNR